MDIMSIGTLSGFMVKSLVWLFLCCWIILVVGIGLCWLGWVLEFALRCKAEGRGILSGRSRYWG